MNERTKGILILTFMIIATILVVKGNMQDRKEKEAILKNPIKSYCIVDRVIHKTSRVVYNWSFNGTWKKHSDKVLEEGIHLTHLIGRKMTVVYSIEYPDSPILLITDEDYAKFNITPDSTVYVYREKSD